MFDKFIIELNDALKKPLPGKVAHQPLKPYLKINKDLDAPQFLSPRIAAVMALIYPVNKIPHILFIERPLYDGVHSGQIAFPGGKIEQNDASVLDAALRETKEEIGVEHNIINVAGPLTEVFVFASNFMVHPFIGILEEPPVLILEEKEVAGILSIPIPTLFEPNIIKEMPIKNPLGITLMAPYYDLNSKVLWGATAMMVSELCAVIKNQGIDFK